MEDGRLDTGWWRITNSNKRHLLSSIAKEDIGQFSIAFLVSFMNRLSKKKKKNLLLDSRLVCGFGWWDWVDAGEGRRPCPRTRRHRAALSAGRLPSVTGPSRRDAEWRN